MLETYDDVLGAFFINTCKKRRYGDIGDRETSPPLAGKLLLFDRNISSSP